MNIFMPSPSIRMVRMVRQMGHTPILHGDGVDGPREAEIDCMLLSGGPDVGPEQFGVHRMQDCGLPDPARDHREYQYVQVCVANEIPVVGICRGAQFLWYYSGGAVAQHVPNQVHDHGIRLIDQWGAWGHPNVTSTHHQCMIEHPRPDDDVWYIAKGGRNNDALAVDRIVEAVVNRDKRFLMVQWHPEYTRGDDNRNLFEALFYSYVQQSRWRQMHVANQIAHHPRRWREFIHREQQEQEEMG